MMVWKMENGFCFSGSAEGGELSHFETHSGDSLWHDRASDSVLFRGMKFTQRLAPFKRIAVSHKNRFGHATPERNYVDRRVLGKSPKRGKLRDQCVAF